MLLILVLYQLENQGSIGYFYFFKEADFPYKISPMGVTTIYLTLNKVEEGFNCFEQTFEERDIWI